MCVGSLFVFESVLTATVATNSTLLLLKIESNDRRTRVIKPPTLSSHPTGYTYCVFDVSWTHTGDKHPTYENFRTRDGVCSESTVRRRPFARFIVQFIRFKPFLSERREKKTKIFSKKNRRDRSTKKQICDAPWEGVCNGRSVTHSGRFVAFLG